MAVANTHAYYNTAIITAVQSSIVQAPAWPCLNILVNSPGTVSDLLVCVRTLGFLQIRSNHKQGIKEYQACFLKIVPLERCP